MRSTQLRCMHMKRWNGCRAVARAGMPCLYCDGPAAPQTACPIPTEARFDIAGRDCYCFSHSSAIDWPQQPILDDPVMGVVIPQVR
jgi:hypothetical protein